MIQFQQDGVGAILDHFWGAGVGPAEYANSAGRLQDTFRDQGKRHLVIELPRSMARGEQLDFTVRRTSMETFNLETGWLETTIDHPVALWSQTIVFPERRPCEQAYLVYRGERFPLHVLQDDDSRTQLRIRVPKPRANTPYAIRWRW